MFTLSKFSATPSMPIFSVRCDVNVAVVKGHLLFSCTLRMWMDTQRKQDDENKKTYTTTCKKKEETILYTI
jgi:hypothetical protein